MYRNNLYSHKTLYFSHFPRSPSEWIFINVNSSTRSTVTIFTNRLQGFDYVAGQNSPRSHWHQVSLLTQCCAALRRRGTVCDINTTDDNLPLATRAKVMTADHRVHLTNVHLPTQTHPNACNAAGIDGGRSGGVAWRGPRTSRDQ